MRTEMMTGDLSYALLPIDTAWAIEPRYGAQALENLRGIDYAAHLAAWKEAEAARSGDAVSDNGYAVSDGGTAVLSISGPLTKKRASFGGGASSVELRRMVRSAKNDSSVKQLAFVIDSPGGQVAGLFDLCDDIAALSAAKPTVAYLEDLCASAAYAIASQCRSIVANPTALVGCIGTYMVVYDQSRAAANAGIEAHVVRAGSFKGAGTAGTKITPEQLAEFQREVDSLNAFFLSAVSKGRKMSRKDVSALADGRVWIASEAKSLGLIDGIASFDETLSRFEAGENLRKTISMAIPSASLAGDNDSDTIFADATPLLGQLAPEPSLTAATGTETIVQPHPITALRAGTVRSAHEDRKLMKEKLVRMLSALGLRRMAVAVVGVQSDDPEALASAMSEQVTEEVADKLAAHPLMMACSAAGITSVSDLQRAIEYKSIGESYVAELRSDAKAQAIRAFGQEAGVTIAASVDSLSPAAVKTLKSSWQTEADVKFGIGQDGSAAKRQTAPAALAQPADAEAQDKPAAAWDRLTDEQRKTGKQMGMDTPKKRETYARHLLGEKDED